MYPYTHTGVMASPVSNDATGCVRGPSKYINYQSCATEKQSGEICVPRYINGVWDRFHPYGADSAACVGPSPPGLVPQVLGDDSLVEASAWDVLSDLSLNLMSNGKIASFSGKVGEERVVQDFSQSDLVQNLTMPLLYSYAVPHESGLMRLNINLTSGYVSVTFPHHGSPVTVQYQIVAVQERFARIIPSRV